MICQNPECGGEFAPKRSYQIYCCKSCQLKAWAIKRRPPAYPPRECARKGCTNIFSQKKFGLNQVYCCRACRRAEMQRLYRLRYPEKLRAANAAHNAAYRKRESKRSTPAEVVAKILSKVSTTTKEAA